MSDPQACVGGLFVLGVLAVLGLPNTPKAIAPGGRPPRWNAPLSPMKRVPGSRGAPYLRILAPNKATTSFGSCSPCSTASTPRTSSAPCTCCTARRTLPAPLSSVLRLTLPAPLSQSSESSRNLCANTPGHRCGTGAGAGLEHRVRALGVLLLWLRARAPRCARELQVSRGRPFPCAVRVSSAVPHTKPARRHGKWPHRPRLWQVARGRLEELQPDLDRRRGSSHGRGGCWRREPRRGALARCARDGDVRIWIGYPTLFRKREGVTSPPFCF